MNYRNDRAVRTECNDESCLYVMNHCGMNQLCDDYFIDEADLKSGKNLERGY